MTDRNEERICSIFQSIAGHYDAMNNFISLGRHHRWKAALINEISGVGNQFLDVCCGTGDITLGIARTCKDANVYGVDFSSEMLKKAEERRKYQRIDDRVRFLQGNALSLLFDDVCFDCAVISFGLRNTRNYETVLKEMTRVIRNGGIVACLDSFRPENRLFIPFYHLYFRHMMPLMGKLFAGAYGEYKWLSESTDSFLSKSDLADMFQKVGLTKVRVRTFCFGACVMHIGIKQKTAS